MKLSVVVPEVSFFVGSPVYLTLMARNPNYKEVHPICIGIFTLNWNILSLVLISNSITVKNGVTDITYLKILNIKHNKKANTKNPHLMDEKRIKDH